MKISEFFSFCGTVEKVAQDFESDSKQFAVVIFLDDHSYTTALLLGSSIIDEESINIHPFVAQNQEFTENESKPQGRVTLLTLNLECVGCHS